MAFRRYLVGKTNKSLRLVRCGEERDGRVRGEPCVLAWDICGVTSFNKARELIKGG